jgi:hypothetical protein
VTRQRSEFAEETIRGSRFEPISALSVPRKDKRRVVENGTPHSWVNDARMVVMEVLHQAVHITPEKCYLLKVQLQPAMIPV